MSINTYNALINQLRATESRSKRTMLDAAADAIENLQQELSEERLRHDRLQDYDISRAQDMAALRNALKEFGGCYVCKHHTGNMECQFEFCNCNGEPDHWEFDSAAFTEEFTEED